MPYRWDVINHLIRQNDYKHYLEIGVLGGDCFDRVIAQEKVGVDPHSLHTSVTHAIHRISSDYFFDSIASPLAATFDIIFIDGLHLEGQVLRDISNSLDHLAANGSIVLHDCLPDEEYQQREDPVPGMPWNGTVWKAWAKMRCLAKSLRMTVVDCDWGCGIIQRGKQKVWKQRPLEWSWDYFCQNRDALMNVISWEEFVCEY